MVPIGKGSRQGPTHRLCVPMCGRSTRQRFPGDFPLRMVTPLAWAHCTSILSTLIKARQSLPGVRRTPGCLFSLGAGDHFPVAAHVKYHALTPLLTYRTAFFSSFPAVWRQHLSMCLSGTMMPAAQIIILIIKKNNCKHHFRAGHQFIEYSASLLFLPVLGLMICRLARYFPLL